MIVNFVSTAKGRDIMGSTVVCMQHRPRRPERQNGNYNEKI